MPVPKGWKEKKVRGIKCSKGSYRIKKVSKRRRLVICCPKGTTRGQANWNAKRSRCRVGTRAVAMQTKR